MEKQKARFSNKNRSECLDYAVNYDNNFMLFLVRKKGGKHFLYNDNVSPDISGRQTESAFERENEETVSS